MYSLFTHHQKCACCGKEFTSQKISTRYCSHTCADKAYKQEQKGLSLIARERRSRQNEHQTLISHDYLSITQSAALLNISRGTLYKIIRTGRLQTQQLTARTIRISRQSLLDYRPELKQQQPEQQPTDSGYITREEVMSTYHISYSWFFSQLKKHSIKAQNIAGGYFYDRDQMHKIFSQEEFIQIKEWYTFQQLREMAGYRTESICDFIHKYKIPKKKTNNITYVSKRHWDRAKGNNINLDDYYTIALISEAYGLSRNHLFCLLRDKDIDRIKIGKFAYFKKIDIHNALKNRQAK